MHSLSSQTYDWPDLLPPRPQPPPPPNTWLLRAARIGLIGTACSWTCGVVGCVLLAWTLYRLSGLAWASLVVIPILIFSCVARGLLRQAQRLEELA